MRLQPAASALAALLAALVYAATRRYSQRRTTSVAMSAAPGARGTGVSLAFVTVPDKDVGHKIARSLVEHKLAACVNIIPGVESVYWWDGKVNSDPELLLKIKTQSALVPALTAHVKSLHPYDECEVTAVDVTGGSDSYLQWVRDSTSSAPPTSTT